MLPVTKGKEIKYAPNRNENATENIYSDQW